MIELARRYGGYGYRRIVALLRDSGYLVNDSRAEIEAKAMDAVMASERVLEHEPLDASAEISRLRHREPRSRVRQPALH